MKVNNNIKKGKTIVTFTIGIISFILTFIIFMQFKFVQNTDITSIENMRQDELKDELVLWKIKLEEVNVQLTETNKKLLEYKTSIENDAESSKLIEEELQQNKFLMGSTDVYGEGIVIYYEDDTKSVTAADLLNLVNQLNMAEAEAISINEQRIVNSTEIVKVDDHMYINGERNSGPYVIKAIGNKKFLESSLTGKNGFVETEIEAGKKVSVEGKSNVQIPKYDKEQTVSNINLE